MHLRCGLLVAMGVALGGCGTRSTQVSHAPRPAAAHANPEPAPASAAPAHRAAPSADDALYKVEASAYPHLHNLLHVSSKIYSGGEPEDEEAFADLARLGVKTVVSVDGARPKVEAAAKYGLRYVHIPIGYEGVPKAAGDALAQLVRTAEGPFYIHCHHGQHRGPAGAAIACIAAGERDGAQAVEILELAGTSKDYPGLWRDVQSYTPPPRDAQLPALAAIAEVGSLAAAMAHIDRSHDRLKLCAAADWQSPPNHPDITPSQEALLVKEGFVEAGRNLAEGYGPPFRNWLEEAAAAAARLETALQQNDQAAATEHFQSLAKSCKQCHGAYRN